MKWNLKEKKSPHLQRKKGSGKGRKGKGLIKGKGFHGNQTLNFKIKEKTKAMRGNEGQKTLKKNKKKLGGKKKLGTKERLGGTWKNQDRN